MNIKTKVYAVSTITNIDVARLYDEAGFRIITIDLDKTITGQYDLELSIEMELLFKRLGEVGFNIALISNAFGSRVDRVRYFAEYISKISGIRCYSFVPADVDNKKKPHPEMFVRALQKANIDSPLKAIHFGDQLRTDVVGAELAGFRVVVAVKPMGIGDNLVVKLFGRPFIEPLLRRNRALPNRVRNFPEYLPEEIYQFIR